MDKKKVGKPTKKITIAQIAGELEEESALNSSLGTPSVLAQTYEKNFSAIAKSLNVDLSPFKDSRGWYKLKPGVKEIVKAMIADTINKGSFYYNAMDGQEDKTEYDEVVVSYRKIKKVIQEAFVDDDIERRYMLFVTDKAMNYSVITQIAKIQKQLETLQEDIGNIPYNDQVRIFKKLTKTVSEYHQSVSEEISTLSNINKLSKEE